MAMNSVQTHFQQGLGGRQQCWYASLMRNNRYPFTPRYHHHHHHQTCMTVNYLHVVCRCRSAFDFSDHVVFYLVHYILVGAIELAYLLEQAPSLSLSPMSAKALCYACAIATSVYLISVSMYAAYNTALYFHTGMESGVALCLALPAFLIAHLVSGHPPAMRALGFLSGDTDDR